MTRDKPTTNCRSSSQPDGYGFAPTTPFVSLGNAKKAIATKEMGLPIAAVAFFDQRINPLKRENLASRKVFPNSMGISIGSLRVVS